MHTLSTVMSGMSARAVRPVVSSSMVQFTRLPQPENTGRIFECVKYTSRGSMRADEEDMSAVSAPMDSTDDEGILGIMDGGDLLGKLCFPHS